MRAHGPSTHVWPSPQATHVPLWQIEASPQQTWFWTTQAWLTASQWRQARVQAEHAIGRPQPSSIVPQAAAGQLVRVGAQQVLSAARQTSLALAQHASPGQVFPLGQTQAPSTQAGLSAGQATQSTPQWATSVSLKH
ncbi:MAG TPA: hypothetical protein VFI22_02620 [Thermomicrobiales bacterium]|nr:hypothetical protein [Thermomicrobiales bacterium]